MTLSAANSLVEEIDESAFKASTLAGYRIAEVCSCYGDIRQRWLVVESSQRRSADLKALAKRLGTINQQLSDFEEWLCNSIWAGVRQRQFLSCV